MGDGRECVRSGICFTFVNAAHSLSVFPSFPPPSLPPCLSILLLLRVRPLQHLDLHGVFADETKHIHPGGLPDAVAAVHGLVIRMRVPITDREREREREREEGGRGERGGWMRRYGVRKADGR